MSGEKEERKKRREQKKKSLKAILLLFWPISLILSWVAAYYPQLAEKCYAHSFAKVFQSFISRMTGNFSFSVAEVNFWLVMIGILIAFCYFILRIIIRKNRRIEIKGFISSLHTFFVFIGIIYFSYTVIWGVNYYRSTSELIAEFEDNNYVSNEELELLAEELIARANLLRLDIPEDEKGVMKIEGGFETIRELASIAFLDTAMICPELDGCYGSPKPIFFSKLMSRAGILGIYSPFTGEANVNIDVPDCILPANVCHEMAHQRGFAQEDEANYIAWMVCNYSDSPEFRYSGTLDALIYVMNALDKNEPEKAEVLKRKYGDALLRDLFALKHYWEEYEGRAKELAADLNNAYLKSQRQEEGVNSYELMVQHLIDKEIN